MSRSGFPSIQNEAYALTSKGAQSQRSRISNTVVPTFEEAFEVQIKPEPPENNLLDVLRDDSPDTAIGDSDDEIFVNAVSSPISIPNTSDNEDFMSQLMAAADSTPSKMVMAFTDSPHEDNVSGPADNFVNFDYDSERTDFLEDPPSPCLRKTKRILKLNTERKNHYAQKNAELSINESPVRRLNFGGRLKKQFAKVTKRSANAQSLEDLRTIEYAPSHNWDEDERELLSVINRWYCATDRATELSVFANIFNSITGLGVKPIRIRNQFECHLRLYGGEAYREYARVFSVPFHDPAGQYAEIRALIEAEAVALGLDLQQRKYDANVPSGRAKFARSPRTRSVYKSLVRKASQEAEWEAARAAVPLNASVATHPTIPLAMAAEVPLGEDWEVVTDVEASPEPKVYSEETSKPAAVKPHLTFRVWDAANRTKFVNDSFVAQTFIDWPRPFPPPIALDDPSEAGKILTVLHLSKQGDTPVYISTASVSTSRGDLEMLLISNSPCSKHYPMQ